MLGVYPLRPVVCDDPQWKQDYDVHPGSIQLASACISAEEAKRLLAEGAEFEAMVLLNGAGEELAGVQLTDRVRVRKMCVSRKWPGAVGLVQERLGDRPISFFQFGGGG